MAALLGFLKKEQKKTKKPQAVAPSRADDTVAPVAKESTPSRSEITKKPAASVSLRTLLYPSVTEKSARFSPNRVCATFIIERSATKSDVRRSVKEVYGVTPLSVQVINEPERRYRTRNGNRRVRRGLKKAMVNFPAGTEIDITKLPHA